MRVEEGLYVESPNACFVRRASTLSLSRLVELGLEFCGSYALDRACEEGFRGRDPLTSAESLQTYVEAATGTAGVKKAAVAARFLANGSASPMESIVAILLCLPRIYGGYGLPLPQLNPWIEVGKRAEGVTKNRHFACDLYWPEYNLAVEYESDRHHTGSERIAGDSRRRNALIYLDRTVVTITRIQLYDARQFHQIAQLLAKRMGKPLRPVKYDWLTRRYHLRQELLFGEGIRRT